MTLEELEKEVQDLRDISEIKDITYQYWYSVDTKNADSLGDVFADGEIHIYFPDMPVWRSRKEFVDFYTSLAMDPSRQENHFGSSPRIKIIDRQTASGNWRLNMFAYNFATRSIMRVTGEYDGEYTRQNGRWKIKSWVFKRHSIFSENVMPDGHIHVPAFGEASAEVAAHLFGDQADA
jgi:SnoaL-like domain